MCKSEDSCCGGSCSKSCDSCDSDDESPVKTDGVISSLKDLDLNSCKDISAVEARIKEKLGISFKDLSTAIGDSVKLKASKIAEDLPNLTPYGNYEKMMENQQDMVNFLVDEGSKPENWAIDFIMESDTYKNVIQFAFKSTAVDDGETLNGFAYVTFNGTIKYAFASV